MKIRTINLIWLGKKEIVIMMILIHLDFCEAYRECCDSQI